ncbi:MAG: hypothetical protein ACT4ON_03975 [Bacteroidota bacterium]
MANTHINQFIQNLSENEIKLVEEHLQKLKPLFNNESDEEIKYLTVFKLLTTNKNKIFTDDEILKHVPSGRIAALKTNLYQKVLEAFSFDKHISNTGIFNEYDSISFILKKRLLIFKILLRSSNQGKTEALHELLNEIINTAKEYEIYEVLTEALASKKYFKGIRVGIKEFDKINEEIDLYNHCTRAMYNAADCYYRLILNNDFIKSFSKKELDNYFSSTIKQMEFDYKKTKSQQVNYYLHIMYFAKCEREKKYSEAIEYCNKIITMLKKSKVIYRKERMGFILDNICQLKIYTGDYDSAAADAKKAQEYYIKNSFEYIMSKEQELHAYLYINETKALVCIGELLEHSLIDTGEFRKSKYVYYKACVLFISKDYKGTLDLLKTSLEIEKDKTRWNISLRILNIMVFIELNKINEASSYLEALSKHIQRSIKEEEIKPRDILIVQLLRKLEKEGFNYDPKNAKVANMLKELSEKDTPLSWEHYSTELVPFHKWFEGKSYKL